MDRLEAATIRATDIMTKLYDAGWNKLNSWSIEDIDLPQELDYTAGASRLVIWDNSHPDFVIKLGISEEDDRYSRREVELYKAAVESGVESQFGWCVYIGDFNGREVFAMEFLQCSYDDFEDESYQWGYKKYCVEQDMNVNSYSARRQYSKYYWDTDYRDDVIIEWFEAQLTETKAAAFDHFIYEYKIDDIHPGNVARRGTEVVLCDYAGWNWQGVNNGR